MKKLIYALSIIFSIAFASSCNDLDVVPIGQLSDGNFPVSDEDAIAVTNAVYTTNIRISTALGYLFDLTTELEAGDEGNPNGGSGLISSIRWDPTNSYWASNWNRLYDIVTRANDVVDKIGSSNVVTPDLKKRLVGEAKFLRAYAYFYLVQAWGEVPLALHATDIAVPRTDINVVYKQIIQDLEDAAVALPAAAQYAAEDKGRATQGAAYAYLSKVYLVWGQTDVTADAATRKQRFTESVKNANLVTGYALEEDFLANWSRTNRNGKESIFSVQHIQGQYAAGDGGNHLVHCAIAEGLTNAKKSHVYAPSEKYYNDFDDRDQRKNGTYIKHVDDDGTGNSFTFTSFLRFRKYAGEVLTQAQILAAAQTRDINRTVIRYAEVLLLKAEAINERDGAPNAEAYEAINQVRRRAFKQFPVTSPAIEPGVELPGGLDYAGFKAKIQQERVFELTYEQNRWTDLVRWRILQKTLKGAVENGDIPASWGKQNVQPFNYRFPIPKAERDINPEGLWQNYGYDGYDPAKTGTDPYAGFE
ncbi:MAG: RagB/SusD family nutrient uptake outer membrane protein [Candidatus Symbiothrix sp.]|jgi:hypothetical protein|nr:RagB/SusD family nutrient uptake outer membrane protein [Candidatus Symbiothrix sp.]